MDLSIILVCWNTIELTTIAVRSVQKHTTAATYEIIVVDNGSTRDGGAQELARRLPDVRLIANPDNRGFAAANNQGLAVARGRYALLLNSDTVQTENAIDRAVNYMDVHSDVGVLGVMHRNNDPGRSYQSSAAAFPTPLYRAREIIWSMFRYPSVEKGQGERITEGDVDWVTGSFLLVRRECLGQVGPLDERFFVYAEDIDWCFRAWQAGWKIRFWPDVSLVHIGSSSAGGLADKTFMMYRNEFEFFRKHHRAFDVFMLYLVLTIRLGFSTLFQVGRWAVGRCGWADVRIRWIRQLNFMTLRSDRRGLLTLG